MGYCSVMPCHTPLSKHQSYPLVMKYGSLNTRTHYIYIYIHIRYHIFMFFPAIRASISHRMLLVINSQNLTSQSSHIPLNHFLKEYPIQSLWQNNALWHHHQGAGTPGLPTGGSGKGGWRLWLWWWPWKLWPAEVWHDGGHSPCQEVYAVSWSLLFFWWLIWTTYFSFLLGMVFCTSKIGISLAGGLAYEWCCHPHIYVGRRSTYTSYVLDGLKRPSRRTLSIEYCCQ